MPLGPPATPAPSAPTGAPPVGAGVVAPSAGASAATASAAPVPVSTARAERDAIATAAAAGALRRRNRGKDPSQLAHHIAAALNVGNVDFGFYWVTALTSSGKIVVANSYGIGYIPAKVLLPEQVCLANADGSIPLNERAQWATYPVLALQGWAQHHHERLRLLIATEDQLQGFDPGVATSILQHDDIPDEGTMRGRTRLQVVAPASAARLAEKSDKRLTDLLPPAKAGLVPPAGDLAMSWFEVSKPLMSGSADRCRVHLKAMAAYAIEASESAQYRTHAECDPGTQRAAIADWLYWQCQDRILAEALNGPACQAWSERG
ncbi:secretion protein EccK [Mycolicibacterium sp.]|uniref:secretion protein EccK n=1 Tax=Mycolicibacterium sp. TaxID=2320850 RepID=UPI003D12C4C9